MAPLWLHAAFGPTERRGPVNVHTCGGVSGRSEWREAIRVCLLSPIFGRTGDLAWRVECFRLSPYSRLTSRRLARVSPSI
jgi:hypothetical protein